MQAQSAPAPAPAIPGQPGEFVTVRPGGPPTAAQMLEAARAQRTELRNQLERAEDQRDELARDLTQTSSGDAVARQGLETRIRETDARISSLDKEIAAADQRVSQAALVPGATFQPPRPQFVRQGPPEEFFVLTGLFVFVVMMPLAIGFSRRLWKRGAAPVSNEVPAELTDRLSRMEQAIDAVAVELERVGEGQRYVTKVFTEQQRALGAGAAEPIELRQREAIHQSRP